MKQNTNRRSCIRSFGRHWWKVSFKTPSTSMTWNARYRKYSRIQLCVLHGSHWCYGIVQSMLEMQIKPNALLVIAHPDDESMFFCPTLLSTRQMYEWHVVCLSTGNEALSQGDTGCWQLSNYLINYSACSGNADGLGRRRTIELRNACNVLKVRTKTFQALQMLNMREFLHVIFITICSASATATPVTSMTQATMGLPALGDSIEQYVTSENSGGGLYLTIHIINEGLVPQMLNAMRTCRSSSPKCTMSLTCRMGWSLYGMKKQ